MSFIVCKIILFDIKLKTHTQCAMKSEIKRVLKHCVSRRSRKHNNRQHTNTPNNRIHNISFFTEH